MNNFPGGFFNFDQEVITVIIIPQIFIILNISISLKFNGNERLREIIRKIQIRRLF